MKNIAKKLVCLAVAACMCLAIVPVTTASAATNVMTASEAAAYLKSVNDGSVVKEFVGGGYHNAALMTDGSVWIWGWNNYGQCGIGSLTEYVNKPTRIISGGVRYLACGRYNTAVITNSNVLYVWGRNDCGQVGDGTTINVTSPKKIATGIREVKMGWRISGAITTAGALYMWGANDCGQVGNNATTDCLKPTRIGTDTYKYFSLGAVSAYAVNVAGELFAWGNNERYDLGDGTTTTRKVPTKVTSISSVAKVEGYEHHAAAITTDGKLYMWGQNGSGQCGNGTTANVAKPTLVSVGGKTVTDVKVAMAHTVALTSDKMAYAWGSNGWGQIERDASTSLSNTPVVLTSNVTSVNRFAFGTECTIGGKINLWGQNNHPLFGGASSSEKNYRACVLAIGANLTGKMTLNVKKSYTYTGKALSPAVSVSYGGKKFTNVRYVWSKTPKAVGKYTLTAVCTGQYVGKVSKTVKIIPKKVKVKASKMSSSRTKLTWTKRGKAQRGYYEIWLSKTSNFQKSKKAKLKRNYSIVNRATSGSDFYVRVRVVKKVGGVKYKSAWSKALHVTMP